MPSPAMIASPVFGARLAAGVTEAVMQSDGTVVVNDIPLFSEIRETDPGAEIGARDPRGKDWLEAAVANTRARIALGKRPIMTKRHIFDDPERVGVYEPERVDLAEVNPGEDPRWTIFGKKIYENLAAFEGAKDYDFRSIEISPDAPNELAALALLRDKEPFHKYPSLVERLAPEARNAFEAAAEIVRKKVYPQVWRSGVEAFAAAGSGREKVQAALRLLTETFASSTYTETTKEGPMPAPAPDAKPETKAPSLEERMESCMAKFEERMMKKFEERFGKASGEHKEPDGDEKPKAPEAHEAHEAHEAKKVESAQASGGPNDMLPPAVAELTVGEIFSARGKVSSPAAAQAPGAPATLTQAEKLELFGLRAFMKRKEAEEQVETFAAAGEKALTDAGVSIDAEIRAEIRSSAKELGKAGVDRAVATISRFAKGAARAPEAFGLASQFAAGMPQPGEDPGLKKAVETFGARPESKARIHELYAAWREQSEHFRRSVPFFDACDGNPTINPNCMEARGGLQRKA